MLLAVNWAGVKVADRVTRRGRYRCMFIKSEFCGGFGGIYGRTPNDEEQGQLSSG